MTSKNKALKFYKEGDFDRARDSDGTDVAIGKLIDIALREQAKQIKYLFTQHCDNCSMCATCMPEFDKRFLKCHPPKKYIKKMATVEIER